MIKLEFPNNPKMSVFTSGHPATNIGYIV